MISKLIRWIDEKISHLLLKNCRLSAKGYYLKEYCKSIIENKITEANRIDAYEKCIEELSMKTGDTRELTAIKLYEVLNQMPTEEYGR